MAEQKSELQKRDVLRMSNEESHRLTKECLQTALIMLMGEKPFEKITITELVKRSGVSRTAFYRSYNTKEDILHEISSEIVDAVAHAFTGKEYESSPLNWYRHMFSVIREKKQEFELLLRADMINNIFEGAMNMIRSSDIPAEEKYLIKAVLGAHAAITVEWFRTGLEESDERMAEICYGVRKALEDGCNTK
ncbi:MAG: TetR/AcrR family transcriptional regulator [Huintestinicola sp.]